MSKMTDEQTVEDIKAQKLAELQSRGESSHQTPSDPIYINGRNEFSQSVNEYSVVLVDFYADWCGPCKMIAPIVEDIAQTTDAAVAKVDVDTNQQLASEYGVRGVPTLLLFANGEPVERIVGLRDEQELRSLIDSYTADT